MGISKSAFLVLIDQCNALLSSNSFYNATGIRLRFYIIGRVHHVRSYKNKVQVLQDYDTRPTQEIGFIRPSNIIKAKNIADYVIAISNIRQKTISEDNICCICFEKAIEILLTCGHGFCQSDIEDWEAREQNCPMCRQSLNKNKMFINLENFKDENDVKQSVEELFNLFILG